MKGEEERKLGATFLWHEVPTEYKVLGLTVYPPSNLITFYKTCMDYPITLLSHKLSDSPTFSRWIYFILVWWYHSLYSNNGNKLVGRKMRNIGKWTRTPVFPALETKIRNRPTNNRSVHRLGPWNLCSSVLIGGSRASLGQITEYDRTSVPCYIYFFLSLMILLQRNSHFWTACAP